VLSHPSPACGGDGKQNDLPHQVNCNKTQCHLAYIHGNRSMAVVEQFILIASKDLKDFSHQVTMLINEGGSLVGNHIVTPVPNKENEFLYSQAIIYHQRNVKEEFGKKPLIDLPDYLK
jgi:hypothetical protein